MSETMSMFIYCGGHVSLSAFKDIGCVPSRAW